MAALLISLSQNGLSLRHPSPGLLHHRIPIPKLRSPVRLSCSDPGEGYGIRENECRFKEFRSFACGVLAVWAVTAASPVIAAGQAFKVCGMQFNSFLLCACLYRQVGIIVAMHLNIDATVARKARSLY
ncbi:hypothetical protein CRG98_003196 [Punica granatum]|uniref:Uncharacterized protein n=1 Tax=Punica granatum TaxID=22663 RepID=A0A2I0L6T1_PUNGR|nr:hypothetical protein CRG98_003196 [Punica granatum]